MLRIGALLNKFIASRKGVIKKEKNPFTDE
jgi:hypothetical protein